MTTEIKETPNTQRCVYCGSVRPVSEMHQGTIIGQGRNRFTGKAQVEKYTNWYCNGTNCHGNDQMAHEG